MTARRRDVFPLRFKNVATRRALKHLAEQTGVPMTEIAERAIEHEIALQGSDLERRLTEALAVVRGYQPEADAEAYIAAAAAGERSGLDPFRDVRAAHAAPGRSRHYEPFSDPFGVLASFKL
jgi:predicted transcriptional regulator